MNLPQNCLTVQKKLNGQYTKLKFHLSKSKVGHFKGLQDKEILAHLNNEKTRSIKRVQKEKSVMMLNT